MSFQSLCEGLQQVIVENAELLNQLENGNFANSVVTETVGRDCKEAVVFLAKIGPKIDLDEYLTNAVLEGDLQLVEFYLKNGAKFDNLIEKPLSKESVVRYIFNRIKAESCKELLGLLIQYGLDSALTMAKGKNIFNQFVYLSEKDDQNAVEIAEILLSFGLSVHEFDSQGCTPLINSLDSQNVQLVSFLIKKGADINQRHKFKNSYPLH